MGVGGWVLGAGCWVLGVGWVLGVAVAVVVGAGGLLGFILNFGVVHYVSILGSGLFDLTFLIGDSYFDLGLVPFLFLF